MKALMTIAILSVCITACSSVKKMAYAPGSDPDVEIQRLEQEVALVVGAQGDVLAPKELHSSDRHLTLARKELNESGPTSDFWDDLAYARAHLHKTKELVTRRYPKIENVLFARASAIIAGARRYERSNKELVALDESFRANARELDKRNLDPEIWPRTKRNYEVLELVTIQESEIGEARDLIQYARSRGALVFAPKTLDVAEEAVKNADRAIAQNPYRQEMYAPLVEKANDVARVLIAINATARKAAGQSNEQVAREIVIRNRAITGLYSELLNAERDLEFKPPETSRPQ